MDDAMILRGWERLMVQREDWVRKGKISAGLRDVAERRIAEIDLKAVKLIDENYGEKHV